MHEYLDFAHRHWLLFVALAIILVLIIYEEIRRHRASSHELAPAAAVQKLNRGALVFDCRKKEAYAKGHIVGSNNLPFDGLGERLKQLKTKRDKPVVAVGATTREASQAAAVLRRAGFKTVYVIKGGLEAWRKDNLPLEQAGTKKESAKKHHKKGK